MGIKTRNFANNILSGGTIDGTDFLSGTLPSSNITNDSAASVTSIPSISNVVSTVAGDPPSPALGDIWYNSSTNALKFQGFLSDAFSSGGNLNTALGSLGSSGTQTAALAFGGKTPRTGATEEYDGTSWANNPTGLNTARSELTGCGTQTVALAFGGYDGTSNQSATEEWTGAAPVVRSIQGS